MLWAIGPTRRVGLHGCLPIGRARQASAQECVGHATEFAKIWTWLSQRSNTPPSAGCPSSRYTGRNSWGTSIRGGIWRARRVSLHARHPRDMYRGRLWTMRQFSGFATPEETNRRYHYLLEQGQTGLSVAFDLPTLMGYDADHALAEGEVGKCGASISSLEDMEILFRGIPLGDVTVSMTINSPAAVLWAMYLAVAEQQGVDWKRLSGTLQNDILKEYIAQKEYIFPPRPSMRLVTDTIEFGARHTPRFNPISISGYHIREAGSTAVQELAFTLRDGMEYVDWALERGLQVDEFAPRLSFFFNAHNDFFEEIAKYRAARKIWAYAMRDRYGAKDERSLKAALPCADGGLLADLAAAVQQRGADGDAGAGGGAGRDAIAAHQFARRGLRAAERARGDASRCARSRFWRYESGVTNTPDPLGGSYFLERLTLDMEKAAADYIRRIDEMGGMIAAIEKGFPQSEIANASYRVPAGGGDEGEAGGGGERVPVGGSADRAAADRPDGGGAPGEEAGGAARAARQCDACGRRWMRCGGRRRAPQNTMPFILDAVRAYATLGEICDALREVFGTYQETAHIRSNADRPVGLPPRFECWWPSRAGRPRPRRQGDRAGAARRRHGGDLYRPAADAGDDRERGAAGRRAGDRALDSFRRAQRHRAAGDGSAAREGHGRT